jgi:5-methylcytosine-specific restriction endonuclease McrA
MTWPKQRRPRPRAYRKNRVLVLERAHYRCQIRGQHCTGIATQDDHIVPLHRGGSNDLANRQAACKACHDEKTGREAAQARAAAQAKTTRPKRKHPGLR